MRLHPRTATLLVDAILPTSGGHRTFYGWRYAHEPQTLQQVVAGMGEAGVRSIPQIGPKRLAEIKQWLATYQLELQP